MQWIWSDEVQANVPGFQRWNMAAGFSGWTTASSGSRAECNFYQLPVKVTRINPVTNGKEVTLDVFSDQAMTNRIYQGLIGITASGTSINSSLSVGQKKFLLGFFSVNLKKALQESQ